MTEFEHWFIVFFGIVKSGIYLLFHRNTYSVSSCGMRLFSRKEYFVTAQIECQFTADCARRFTVGYFYILFIFKQPCDII